MDMRILDGSPPLQARRARLAASASVVRLDFTKYITITNKYNKIFPIHYCIYL